MKPLQAALALGLLILPITAVAETKTVIVDGCAKVETEYADVGAPRTMTVKCTGETVGPRVRQEIPVTSGTAGNLLIAPGAGHGHVCFSYQTGLVPC